MSKRMFFFFGIVLFLAIISAIPTSAAKACGDGKPPTMHPSDPNLGTCGDDGWWTVPPEWKPTATPTAPPPTQTEVPNQPTPTASAPAPTVEATSAPAKGEETWSDCSWYEKFDAAGHTCVKPVVPATAAPEPEELPLVCNLSPAVFTDRISSVNGNRTIVRRDVDKDFRVVSEEATDILSTLGGDNSDPSGAPTGWISFVHNGEIWTAGHNGANPRSITHKGEVLKGSMPFVAKVPCASTIVFTDENGILNVTDRSGSFLRPLVEGSRANTSPDGRDVLFETTQGTIGAVSISGPKTLLRDFGIDGSMPSWHSEGKGIFFVRSGDIWFFDFEANEEARVMQGAQLAPNPARSDEGLLIQGTPLGFLGLRAPLPDLWVSNATSTKKQLNRSWIEIEFNPDHAVPANGYNRTPFVLHALRLAKANRGR